MFHKTLGFVSALIFVGLLGAAQNQNQNQNQNAQNKANQSTTDQAKDKQSAKITSVDVKNGTVTVQMKDQNGKEVNKSFKLTEDIRYFDSTGKAIAIDVFRSGDNVLVVEAQGRLREVHRHGQVSTAALSDQDFLKEVAQIDLAEMKLGQYARDMAASAAIKKYGERLLTDHTKMNSELGELAKARGVTLPSKTDKKDQELIDQLAKIKGGADFDRAFSKNMVAGHEQAIKIFEAQAKNGQNADVKAWAEKWLPTLKEHLRLARSAAQN
jgi:putative membrane protein